MGAAEDRLAQELEEAEERIGELEREVERLQDHLPWTQHEEIEATPDMPVPRLEMVWEEGKFPRDYQYRCAYRLVYRHLLGHLVAVPLGETMVGSTKPPDHFGEIDTPFRDGAHIKSDARQLGLPAYVRWGDKVERIDPGTGSGPTDRVRGRSTPHRLLDSSSLWQ